MSLEVSIRKQLGSFALDVSFTAEQGVTCLLGASGCGKSVTLKCIAGIEKPDAGRVALDGRVLFDSARGINLSPQERRVGYLFQNYALFPHMTARQNILCGLCRQKDREARERRYREILHLLQLEGLEGHRPAQLSGGQAQRVALARILVGQPGLLMLDEPFSALDVYLREKLTMELRDLLRGFGGPVLMVSHSRDEAYHMSKNIAVMHAGRLLTVKDTRSLFADPESVEGAVLTGCKNIIPAERSGEHRVSVPEWGVELETAQSVRHGLKAIGIRAHQFGPDIRENRLPVAYSGEMEEPFEVIIQFRYLGQRADTQPVWWRLPRERRPERFPPALGVAPEDVLLLYEKQSEG